jgi:serine-threonine kinase receptor-associated protein
VVGLQYSTVTTDGTFLLSACHDKTAMLRDGETGDWIGTFEGHNGAVWWASLNKSATRAATASGDFSAKVWDAVTGDDLQTFKHNHIVRTIDWLPGDRQIATAGKEKIVRIFDLQRPDAEPLVMTGHEQLVRVLLATDEPTGQQLLTGSDDKSLRTWDVRTLAETRRIDFDGPVNSVEVSADGSVLTVAAGSTVHFLERSTLRLLKKHALPVVEGVNSAALSPDGKSFVAGGCNFWVYLHDFETGQVRRARARARRRVSRRLTTCSSPDTTTTPLALAIWRFRERALAHDCASARRTPHKRRSSSAQRGTTGRCTACGSRRRATCTRRVATTAPSARGA